MGYHHLSIDERECIMTMLRSGEKIRSIAGTLGRSPSTITRELHRNTKGKEYSAIRAQTSYVCRRMMRRGPRWVHDEELYNYVLGNLSQQWSPEQVTGRLRLEQASSLFRVSNNSIYRWIKRDRRKRGKLYLNLRHQGRSRKSKDKIETRGKLHNVRDISERPAVVDALTRYGDWEVDTVWSRRGRSVLVTLTERNSSYFKAVRASNRQAETVNHAIIQALSDIPKCMLHTITVDRGKEFSQPGFLEKQLGIKVYHTRPYCSWQKGRIENANGLLRQYFPRDRSLDHVSQEEIDRAVALLNNRPRKNLGFKTPIEVLQERGLLHFT